MATTAQWVRFALSGSADGAKPSSDTITLLEAGARAAVINQWPSCLQGAPGSLSGATLEAFTEAVGYFIASEIVVVPGGEEFVRHVTALKQGTVSKTFSGSASSPADASRDLLAKSNQALTRILCIREALSSSSRPAMLTLAGRRRSVEANHGS